MAGLLSHKPEFPDCVLIVWPNVVPLMPAALGTRLLLYPVCSFGRYFQIQVVMRHCNTRTSAETCTYDTILLEPLATVVVWYDIWAIGCSCGCGCINLLGSTWKKTDNTVREKIGHFYPLSYSCSSINILVIYVYRNFRESRFMNYCLLQQRLLLYTSLTALFLLL